MILIIDLAVVLVKVVIRQAIGMAVAAAVLLVAAPVDLVVGYNSRHDSRLQ